MMTADAGASPATPRACPDDLISEANATAPGMPGYITEDELARRLGRHPKTVARWRRLRKVPPFTMVGRVPLYRETGIDPWLRAGEIDPAATPKRKGGR